MSTTYETKQAIIVELIDQLIRTADGGERVQILRMIRETSEAALPQAVAQARAENYGWESIGRYLGVTRQAASMRYGGAERTDKQAG